MSIVVRDRLGNVVPSVPSTVGLLPGPGLAWAALFVNVLAFTDMPMVIPIPTSLAQVLTQGSLILALLLALLANPRAVIRPTFFMLLLTALAVVALMVSIHNEFLVSATYRGLRLLGFVGVLWLLTPWWGRPEFDLLRSHLTCLRVAIATVLIGAVLSPAAAFSYGGRLSGALWPMPPTQVAHYAAILLGCTAALWFGRLVSGRAAAITLLVCGGALLGTHTRTALLAMGIGLAVAGASMFLGNARVRRTAATVVILGAFCVTMFASVITTWLWRGQTAQDLSQLTGRTKVWSGILQLQRPELQELFGSGLSNKSFNGMPIDSNWLAAYLELGWFGVAINVALLLTVILLAINYQRGARRAVALFLVAYCLVASITETGLSDASPYLLELVLAASLVAAPAREARL